MTAGREEALRLDAYLDSDDPRRPWLVPDAHGLDPDLRRAVDVLRAGIMRVHPSFRFVEELASRLRREAEALVADRFEARDPEPGELVPFPPAAHAATPGARPHRAFLVRGAISGVSLAGVAYVAWRLGRLTATARRGGLPGMPSLPGGHA